jgi:pyruvate formate-lyase activating enzyme-like uncharacterized protein
MRETRQLPDSSFVQGSLPISCVMCQQGSKLVLLVTGICSHDCYYCPLSSKKKGHDDTYADEKLVKSDADVIFEAKSIGARGTGITGGDPLLVMDRTLHYIRLLKKNFGTKHNIHLYTATPDLKKIALLADAGLDEIRFHPPPDAWGSLEATKYPDALRQARECGMKAGIEIPAIPGLEKSIIRMAREAKKAGAQFINLNELEFSEPNWDALHSGGFKIKDDVSSAAKGSQEAAGKIAAALGGVLIVHYCSSSFKDATQLRNRLLRRANNVATGLEIITDDGTFLKGIIETPKPEALVRKLREEFGIPAGLIRHDAEKNRVEIAAWVLEELPANFEGLRFIVEEYPTADRLEVERRPLN